MEATTQSRLSHDPISQKRDVLEALTEYGFCTVKDLARVLKQDPTKVTLSSLVRTTRLLEQQGYVNRIYFQPQAYTKKRGLLPFAIGLSKQGVQWAYENEPMSDPELFTEIRSPLMIPHDLKTVHYQIALTEYCDTNGLELFTKKTDLYHTVEPDRLFAIKGKTTQYYFFELERHRKTHKALLKKFQRYENYYGTELCKREWHDFKTFTVLTQMRSEESRLNILKYLAGEPAIWNGKRYVNDHPIKRTNFWFSTEQDPFIFKTPKDFQTKTYTLLDK